ncbi:Cephalosporin hydroxylase [Synechococcus sp. BL107]|uniref:CmcI family methyltransferase n=1 Tax=Synechococcus sp. BL107 TaxID=313625 RepID=UPI0000E53A96|nr:CmcI family methyltransferase [Synechococcus sp. BL107]EAU71048.1 Cephalosporin hydroxylase [Synechococcus sp. BL107]
MQKKLFSRVEFEQHLSKKAAEQFVDSNLSDKALEAFVGADKHDWIHQTRWFGEPALQTAEDMLVMQDILFRTKPDFFIEVGTAWSGSLLMYATIMEALNFGHIIGIDIYIPEDLIERINSFENLSKRITLIKGSSLDAETIKRIDSIVGDASNISVHLDSDHSHEHVLQELKKYSKYVSKGNYLICGDTVVEDIPEQSHRPRPWGVGNNPKTAMIEFLNHHHESFGFTIDKNIRNRLLLSNQKEGYLLKNE